MPVLPRVHWLIFAVLCIALVSCKPVLTKSNTTLHEAALLDRKDILIAHLDDGEDVNGLDYFDKTPLHCAAQGGNTEIISLLVSRGADLNKVGLNGWTPLFMAVMGTRPRESVEVLVNLGADPTVRDVNGEKASDLAEEMHDSETASYLRSHGG